MYNELSNDVTKQVLMGINIPPCPESLTAIMREAKKVSTDFSKVAQLIERDAGLVGPLLKLTNSPFVGLRQKVSSVLQAVNVLGMQNTLNLVQNIALRQSMGDNPQRFDAFWERSSLTASIAQKLAAKFPGMNKDDAYITALFHDCGISVLMMKYTEYHEVVKDERNVGKNICDVENDIFSSDHTVVGNMLTRSWLLPAHVSKAILHHHDVTIFTLADERIHSDIPKLIGIVLMAERIVDEHLEIISREWQQFERHVLGFFEISPQEFFEIKQDVLAFLNNE